MEKQKFIKNLNFLSFLILSIIFLFFSGCATQRLDLNKYEILYEFDKSDNADLDLIYPLELFVFEDDLYYIGVKDFTKKKNVFGQYKETKSTTSVIFKNNNELLTVDRITEVYVLNTSMLFIGNDINKKDFIAIYENDNFRYIQDDNFSLKNVKKYININNNSLTVQSLNNTIYTNNLINDFKINCSNYDFTNFEYVSDCVNYMNKPTLIAGLNNKIYILRIKDN